MRRLYALWPRAREDGGSWLTMTTFGKIKEAPLQSRADRTFDSIVGFNAAAPNHPPRQTLCVKQDYVKFEYLTQQPWVGRSSHAHITPSSHWKHVYAQAHTLEWNWRRGSYVVPPLLKGHRLTVTSIAHDG